MPAGDESFKHQINFDLIDLISIVVCGQRMEDFI